MPDTRHTGHCTLPLVRHCWRAQDLQRLCTDWHAKPAPPKRMAGSANWEQLRQKSGWLASHAFNSVSSTDGRRHCAFQRISPRTSPSSSRFCSLCCAAAGGSTTRTYGHKQGEVRGKQLTPNGASEKRDMQKVKACHNQQEPHVQAISWQGNATTIGGQEV